MIISFFSEAAKETPFIAQLSLSVPPEVKYISSGAALMHSAIVLLASKSAFLGIRENAYGYSPLTN